MHRDRKNRGVVMDTEFQFDYMKEVVGLNGAEGCKESVQST